MTTERRELYGFSRKPARVSDMGVTKTERLPYGRFRNVYVYITEACQLRCEHCYMGDRLDRALKMSSSEIRSTLLTWRTLGGSKLTILGGEPTLHPDFIEAVKYAGEIGYEHVITTTNGLNPAMRKLRRLAPAEFAYVQVSLDGVRLKNLPWRLRPAGQTPTSYQSADCGSRTPSTQQPRSSDETSRQAATVDRLDHVDEVESASQRALMQMVSNPTDLEKALVAVASQPDLLALCEHYDILDKIVLFNDHGVRVRLHVFLPGYFDRPHNHRWSYASLILTGRYRHALYGADGGFDDSVDARQLRPLMVRDEQQGSRYALHDSMVHAVIRLTLVTDSSLVSAINNLPPLGRQLDDVALLARAQGHHACA